MRSLAIFNIPTSSSVHQKGLLQASYKLGDELKLTLGLSAKDYQPFICIGKVYLNIEDIEALLKHGGARDFINTHLEQGSGMVDWHLTDRIDIVFCWKMNEPVIKLVARHHQQNRSYLDYREWNTLCLLEFCITGHLNRLIRCGLKADTYIKHLFNGLRRRDFEKQFEDTCDPSPTSIFYSDCCIVMKDLCERILDFDEYVFLSEMCLYHLNYLYA